MPDYCIACKEEAIIRLSPDLDIKGLPVCEDCKEQVKDDLFFAMMTEEIEWFEDKYNLTTRNKHESRR